MNDSSSRSGPYYVLVSRGKYPDLRYAGAPLCRMSFLYLVLSRVVAGSRYISTHTTEERGTSLSSLPMLSTMPTAQHHGMGASSSWLLYAWCGREE
jgi:hypothetical protein